MKRLTPFWVKNAWTSNPRTKDFQHIKPFPKTWLRKVVPASLRPPNATKPDLVAKVSDRIRYWNIVPGDLVRIRGHRIKHIMEVAQINRLSNEVRLRKVKEDVCALPDRDPTKLLRVHYSRLQLFWKHIQLEGKEEPTPVFVATVRRGHARYFPREGYVHWKRYVLKTAPRLPKQLYQGQAIPWPTKELEKIRAENYISSASAVSRVTYVPPDESALAHMWSPSLVKRYVRSLYNPQYEHGVVVADPMEVHLTRELSNPYSRAKRQARWKARLEYRKLLLSQIMTQELKNLDGRSRRDARAEATFKWKQQLAREDAVERLKRKVKRGDQAKEDRKRARRMRKEKRRIDILRKLVLQEGAGTNQIIPGRQLVKAIA
ncbi:hypothetical protein K488DRAFT_46183 [Vararia minispora EC-137]|uniref:Uncharacterized protein n=1 Tax=Vararia minispora EC-137 TaxID=1314806 RepID=A0ACB8QRN6_9AGAM|nr:hypothetical protein K488DRAFT_46183 [Vararia minispora EC-137]